MTTNLKRAIRRLLDEANKQGEDRWGNVHYVDRQLFDDVQFYFEQECRKQGDVKYLRPEMIRKGVPSEQAEGITERERL